MWCLKYSTGYSLPGPTRVSEFIESDADKIIKTILLRHMARGAGCLEAGHIRLSD